MNKLIAGALLATIALAQQQPPSEKPSPEAARKLVELRYLAGPRADRASELIRQFMHPVGRIQIDSQLKSAVLVGPPDVVASAEALLRKFDVPEVDRNNAQVTLAIHLIEASNEDESRGNPVHKVIEPAVEQMRRAFQFKHYRQLDTVVMVGRGTDRGRVSGQLPILVDVNKETRRRVLFDAGYEALQVFPESKSVGIRKFGFTMHIPVVASEQYTRTELQSDLTINYGQKLVVGKLSADQPNNAIFLVLTVEIQ